MKDRILQLRSQGKTYDEIVKILGCAKSTVAYHASEKVRQNYLLRQRRDRQSEVDDLKLAHGGKCIVCDYDRSLKALDFHHVDSSEKIGSVSNLFDISGKTGAAKEAEKCLLLCANCHRETHEGLIYIAF